MKLQRHKAYKYKGKEQFKYVLVVNEKLVDSLGWKEGDELVAEKRNGKLVVGKGN